MSYPHLDRLAEMMEIDTSQSDWVAKMSSFLAGCMKELNGASALPKEPYVHTPRRSKMTKLSEQ